MLYNTDLYFTHLIIKFVMNAKITAISSDGATNASLAKRFAKAATKFSGKCVDVKNTSAKKNNLALYLVWKISGSNIEYNFP